MRNTMRNTTKSHIYHLIDPRDGKIRYVGKAVDVQERLRGHLNAADAKSEWISELRRAGMVPLLKVVRIVVGNPYTEEAQEISKCLSQGEELLNHHHSKPKRKTPMCLDVKVSPNVRKPRKQNRIKKVKINIHEGKSNPLVPCACGCGTMIFKFHNRTYLERRYANGHNVKEKFYFKRTGQV
jgi:hypothetical protein